MNYKILISELDTLIEEQHALYEREFDTILLNFEFLNELIMNLFKTLDNSKINEYVVSFIDEDNLSKKLKDSKQILITNKKHSVVKILKRLRPEYHPIDINHKKAIELITSIYNIDKKVSSFLNKVKDAEIFKKIFNDIMYSERRMQFNIDQLIYSLSELFFKGFELRIIKTFSKKGFFSTTNPIIGCFFLLSFSHDKKAEYYELLLSLPIVEKLPLKTKKLFEYIIRENKREYFLGFSLYLFIYYTHQKLDEDTYKQILILVFTEVSSIFQSTEFNINYIIEMEYSHVLNLIKLYSLIFFDVRDFYNNIPFLGEIKERILKSCKNPIIHTEKILDHKLDFFVKDYISYLGSIIKKLKIILSGSETKTNIENFQNYYILDKEKKKLYSKILRLLKLIIHFKKLHDINDFEEKYEIFFKIYNQFKNIYTHLSYKEEARLKSTNIKEMEEFEEIFQKINISFNNFILDVLNDFSDNFNNYAFKDKIYKKLTNSIKSNIPIILIVFDCFRYDLFLIFQEVIKKLHNITLIDSSINLIGLPTNTVNFKNKLTINKEDFVTIDDCENFKFEDFLDLSAKEKNHVTCLYFQEFDKYIHRLYKEITIRSVEYLNVLREKLYYFVYQLNRLSSKIENEFGKAPLILITADHGFIEVDKPIIVTSNTKDEKEQFRYRYLNLDQFEVSKDDLKYCYKFNEFLFIVNKHYFALKNKKSKTSFLSHGGLSPFENLIPYIKFKFAEKNQQISKIKFKNYDPKRLKALNLNKIILKFKNPNINEVFKIFNIQIFLNEFIIHSDVKEFIDFSEEFEIEFFFFPLGIDKKIDLRIFINYEKISGEKYPEIEKPIPITFTVDANE